MTFVRVISLALLWGVGGIAGLQQTPAVQQASVAPAGADAAAGVCGAAPVVAADSRPNIFNVQQELWLGEASKDEMEGGLSPVQDTELAAHLQAIVDRLAKNLPEPHVPFHVTLVESSEVNGFSIAGGSIYLTRKLVASTRSDDELAAVLGHEMGHIASHQFAFEMTAEMKRLLGVTAVGDRKDIYAKVHQLTDAAMKDKHPPKDTEEVNQGEADRVGVYLTAAAGYRPQAFLEVFDRTAFVGGKTGSRLTDFFHMTKPNEKRLRAIRAMLAALPAGCAGAGSTPTEQTAFDQWEKKVTANQKGLSEKAEEGATEIKLTPALQMEVNRLRFSPDGKLLLAQDESSIYVLQRSPLAVKFRMDADRAQSAWFSPDSSRVTFTTPGLHIEEWSVADQKLIAAHEPVVKDACLQTKLSPDGRTAMCVSLDEENWKMDLSLLDATSGAVVWQKKGFFEPNYGFARTLLIQHSAGIPSELLWSSFSGDGNFLLVGPGESKVAFDLRTRTPVKVTGALKSDLTGAYAFLGSNRVAGVDSVNGRDSGIFSFPEGKQLKRLAFSFPDMESVSDPGDKAYVLTESIHGQPAKDAKPAKPGEAKQPTIEAQVAIADLELGKYVYGSKSNALDLWKEWMATEAADGAVLVGTFSGGVAKGGERITLPVSPLGRLEAVDVSPDGRYLAYSTRDRGGLWDLHSGARLSLVHAFSSAVWTGEATMYAEFEKPGSQERQVVEIDLAKHTSKIVDLKFSDDEKDYAHMMYGHFLEWKTGNKHAEELSVHRLQDGSVAWTKMFADGYPRYTASFGWKDLIFSYPMRDDAAKNTIKGSAGLTAEAALIKKKENGRLIEVVDAETGATVGQMVIEVPLDYEGTGGLNRAGDQVYVTGEDNRTLAYSLTTGKQLWQAFGRVTAVDAVNGRVCLVNRRDEAIVYDSGGEEVKHLHGGTPIRFAAFVQGGSKLLMLMADQSVRTVGVVEARTATVTAEAK